MVLTASQLHLMFTEDEKTGLVFDDEDIPRWIRVSIVHEGPIASGRKQDRRWIRLTSIDQVIPCLQHVCLDNYVWKLQVKTNTGEVFYASEQENSNNLIKVPQFLLMSAIDAAVTAMTQPAELGAQPKRV